MSCARIIGALLVALVAACSMDWPGGLEPEADGDAGGDADADGDTDGDSDGDGDMDADADGDSDGDSDMDDDARWVGQCLDGVFQVQEGFTDCESFECLTTASCCLDTTRPWVQGDFSVCDSLAACGWSAFPADEDAQELASPWLRLSATDAGETGVYTEAVAELTGEPEVTFAAYLDPVGCDESGCRQQLGIAFTAQELLSAGTGVAPTVGIVLDGELESVHFLVGGRVEQSVPLPLAALTQEQGYAIRIRVDGTVAFWQGLPVNSTATGAPDVVIDGAPSFESSAGQLPAGESLRLALFGRFSGIGAGMVGGVGLDRPICDVPDGFERPIGFPVFSPSEGTGHVGRPAIVERHDRRGLLMVYESDSGLAAATSDDGDSWETAASTLNGLGAQQGVSRPRAPTLIHLDDGALGPGYHMWFEADFVESANDEPRVVILHASSPDGFEWSLDAPAEADAPVRVALSGSTEHPWRTEARQPSVVEMDDGTLTMFFVGRNPVSGATAIGRATSGDGASWDIDAAPLALSTDGPLAFERDGVASPTAVRRGGVIHLWYTGFNGAGASIGYAVGVREIGLQWSWLRLGPVLEPEEVWEAERVQDPAVLTLAPEGDAARDGEGVAVLHIWYQGGLPGRGLLGLATREMPAQVEAIVPDDAP